MSSTSTNSKISAGTSVATTAVKAAKGKSKRSLVRIGIRKEDVTALPETFLVVSLGPLPGMAGSVPIAIQGEKETTKIEMGNDIGGESTDNTVGTETSSQGKGTEIAPEVKSNTTTTNTEVASIATDPKVKVEDTGTASTANTEVQNSISDMVNSISTDPGVKFNETATSTNTEIRKPALEVATEIGCDTTATEVKSIETASNASIKPNVTDVATQVKNLADTHPQTQFQEEDNDHIEISFSGYYKPQDSESRSMMLSEPDGLRNWTNKTAYYKKLESLQKTFGEEFHTRNHTEYTLEKYQKTRALMREKGLTRMDYLRDCTKATIRKDPLRDYEYEIYIVDKHDTKFLGTLKGLVDIIALINVSRRDQRKIRETNKQDRGEQQSEADSWAQPQPELELLPLPERLRVRTRVREYSIS